MTGSPGAEPDASGLSRPLTTELGARTAAKLGKQLGLHTVGDLLRHYPRRYERWGQLTPLRELPQGESVTIAAEVVSASSRPMRQRRGDMLSVVVTDGVDTLGLTFFNARYLKDKLVPGRRALFSGTVGSYQGRAQLTQPKMIFMDDESDEAKINDLEKPIPIYPATAGLDTTAIRKSVGMLLDTLAELPDPLPEPLRARHALLGLREALVTIHRPDDDAAWRAARRRLVFEEAFVLQVALARRRASERALVATPRHRRDGGLLDAFDQRLPFALTAGQREVGAEIMDDLARGHPMHRLLQGEVGSGKTVVALRAMLAVVDAGGQAALLAPTEVLAGQHWRSITAMLGDLARGGMLDGDERATRVALLTGSLPTAARRSAMLDAISGDAGIVIGTHALLHENVAFHDLGLVVVDEQHRFGVEQRDALRGKGRTSPHVLVMTATPIPRTVAMTVFGDLETSTLRELPAGRSPIATHVVPVAQRPGWYDRVWARVREEVDRGHQAYVVCARIGDDGGDPEPGPIEPSPTEPGLTESGLAAAASSEPDAVASSRAVLEVLAQLRSSPALAGLTLEMLHGRLPSDARDDVMSRFARGQVDVLVATTVIEVGVDVPNASVMVVLDADRFGISQLHQLRGRVGRGDAAGVCLLVTDAPPATPARDRLDALAATLDGFELARVDLEQRREGDVLGARQSGMRSSLRLLRVLRDEKVIEQARQEASDLVARDPTLAEHPGLAAALEQLLDADREAYLERG